MIKRDHLDFIVSIAMIRVKLSNLCYEKLHCLPSSSFLINKLSVHNDLVLKHSQGALLMALVHAMNNPRCGQLCSGRNVLESISLNSRESSAWRKSLCFVGLDIVRKLSVTLPERLAQVPEMKVALQTWGGAGGSLAAESESTRFREAFWAPTCWFLVWYGADAGEAGLLLLLFCSLTHLERFFCT